MASLPENSGAEMDSMILSNDLLTQFQRTLAETSPGQMQADLQTILAASMSMAPSVGAPDEPLYCCSLPRQALSISCPTTSAATARVHPICCLAGLSCAKTCKPALPSACKQCIAVTACTDDIRLLHRLACRG